MVAKYQVKLRAKLLPQLPLIPTWTDLLQCRCSFGKTPGLLVEDVGYCQGRLASQNILIQAKLAINQAGDLYEQEGQIELPSRSLICRNL